MPNSAPSEDPSVPDAPKQSGKGVAVALVGSTKTDGKER